MLALAREHQLSAEQVTKIDVFITPARSHRRENLFRGPFKVPGQAYSSMPFALALALLDGRVDPARYTPMAIQDPKITTNIQKINIGFEDGHDVERYCRLEVHTNDGRKLSRDSDFFMFPFPRSDWGEWLQKDGHRLLSAEQLQKLEHDIIEIENLDDVTELMKSVVPTEKAIQTRRTG
jgi:2-methylcitrate dehydratase PrpD